jgi:3-methylfumaryl-CoA hydratase
MVAAPEETGGGAADLARLAAWVGRTERRFDRVSAVPVAALAATLDREDPEPREGAPIAPLRHWLYFLPLHRQSEIGPDGHARRGGFLPPVPLPRRMWAGGRLEFRAPLRVGDAIERESRIARVDVKEGRTGTLVFVLVRHEITAARALAIVEEHDIVYRDAARPGDPPPPKRAAPRAGAGETAWRRDVLPDPVLLFRYSALTFNGHRIHYDQPYVTHVEGYPGLVVHGPLIATLLVDLARDRAAPRAIASFSFRAVAPLFETAPFAVCGKPAPDGNAIALWAEDEQGNLAMEATATLR